VKGEMPNLLHLYGICFVDLVADAGTVHTLKTMICLLTNPHYPVQPIALALWENTNFSADDNEALLLSFSHLSEGLQL
jgi:hypothetical protein